MDDELNVWFEDQLVGYLWRNGHNVMAFRYSEEWLASGFPLSISLPLQNAAFSAQALIAHRFFAHLLPEGQARERLCHRFRCPNTDFDLLKTIGGECAGAISILPVTEEPDLNQHYEKLSAEALERLISTRGASLANDCKPRLSLAGAQDKITVYLKHQDIYLPVKQSSSTHILKFEVSDFKNVPLYEVYTTWLAKATGLNVIDMELRCLANASYTLSRRYDRLVGDKISRIHQEDFCQALGLQEKYQRNETPSFAQCYRLLIQHSNNPTTDCEQLLRWQIFNLIAGNSDAHIKNISLLYSAAETRLAPFYDLVCTRAIQHLDSTLALSIGQQKNPDNVLITDWYELAKQCQIRPRHILSLVEDMLNKVNEQKASVKGSLEEKYGNLTALQRVDQVINKQLKRISMSMMN
ncbi:type II toxin-antitoxin system HipA family toxin [Methylovulum sp.]|uniref:type II toxin-antitoxin system HipA family toxin n=1 Tax=Methylovulum sp. TaxID=1916980 RepID=UPI002610D113|nr:type II toxin-antitoxin system HipA family toxin [Methylovulum sp.]MDD5126458.1 type II toxin-antitoxin system HipA family toxin [Methylovulum sp.]